MNLLSIFPILLALCLAAGCTAPGRDIHGLNHALACPVVNLADAGVTNCDTPTRFQQDLAASAPAGWKCEGGVNFGAHQALEFLTDGNGHYGFWFDWDHFPEPVVARGRAVLQTGGHADTVDFGPTTTGFVRFPGTYTNGTVHIVTYGLAAEGRPAFLNTSTLKVIQLDNPEGPIYVWQFTGPRQETYKFASLTYLPTEPTGFHWAPSNIRTGDDFVVQVKVYRGIATDHKFDFGNQDPLSILRKHPGC